MRYQLVAKSILVLVGSLLGMASHGAEGVDGFPAPSSFEYKNLIVESVYNYQIGRYEKPILVEISDAKKDKYLTPHDVLQAHFSAMRNLDYKWFISTWDDSSVVLMENRNRALNRGDKYWIDLWAKLKLNSTVQINGWVRYGQYVLVDYAVLTDAGKDGMMSDIVALKKINDEWRFTQELSTNPLLSKNNLQVGRVRRLGD